MKDGFVAVVAFSGRSKRTIPGDSVDPERSARLPRVLAAVQHHGCQSVRRQIQQLR